MEINKLIPPTALGRFGLVVALAAVIGGGMLGWQYYNTTAKFSAIAKIPPVSEYNLTDAGNQAAYERLKKAYEELSNMLIGKTPYNAPIIDVAVARANAFKDLGDTGRAILAYQWLNKYRPGGLQGFSNLANLYVGIGEYEKAEKNYLIAIANTKGLHIEPYEGLFNLYQAHLKDKWPQIEQILFTALSQNPDASINFHNLLAQYYESVSRTGDAIIQYKEVLKSDPNNAAIKNKIRELEGK